MNYGCDFILKMYFSKMNNATIKREYNYTVNHSGNFSKSDLKKCQLI